MRARFQLLATVALALTACGGTAAAPGSSPPAAAASVAASKPAAATASAKPASSAEAKPAGSASAAAGASDKPAASAPAKPAGSASGPAQPAASGLVNLVVGHSNPIPETMMLYTAKEAGIFDKNGLNVDIRLISGGATAMAAVVSGDTPFSHLGGSEAMSSAAGGADIVVLAVTSPISSFVLEVAADIKSAADLKGQRLGVSTIGSSSDIALRTALIHLGLDADKDVVITPVGSTATRTAAMLSGAIKGSAELPADVVAVEKAGFHPLLDMAAMKIPSVGQSIVAQRAYVTAHRDIAQKYVDSIVQAGVVSRNDRATTIKTISKWTKVDDLDAIGVAYDLYEKQTYTPTPLPKPELWADAKTILGAKNDAIKNYDVGRLVDPSFVQSAIDRGLNK